METQRPRALVLRAEAFSHRLVPDAARGPILRDFLEEIAVRVEEEGKPWRKIVHIHSTAHTVIDIFDSVAQRERKFLNRGRTSFADVITADGNRIEFRRVLRAEFESIDHQPHRRFRRIDVLLLRDIFLENVVLQSTGDFLPIGALLFRDRQIHRPDHRRRRIDRHRSRHIGERNLVEQHFHIRQRADRYAALSDFAFRERVIGVVTHQRRQIKRDGKTCLPLRKQVTKARVRVLSRAEARELAHGPKLAAVHRGVNAAGVGRLAGEAEIAPCVPACKIPLRVKPSNRIA